MHASDNYIHLTTNSAQYHQSAPPPTHTHGAGVVPSLARVSWMSSLSTHQLALMLTDLSSVDFFPSRVRLRRLSIARHGLPPYKVMWLMSQGLSLMGPVIKVQGTDISKHYPEPGTRTIGSTSDMGDRMSVGKSSHYDSDGNKNTELRMASPFLRMASPQLRLVTPIPT